MTRSGLTITKNGSMKTAMAEKDARTRTLNERDKQTQSFSKLAEIDALRLTQDHLAKQAPAMGITKTELAGQCLKYCGEQFL